MEHRDCYEDLQGGQHLHGFLAWKKAQPQRVSDLLACQHTATTVLLRVLLNRNAYVLTLRKAARDSGCWVLYADRGLARMIVNFVRSNREDSARLTVHLREIALRELSMLSIPRFRLALCIADALW